LLNVQRAVFQLFSGREQVQFMKSFVATTMCLLISEIYKKYRFYQNFFDVRHIGATECLCSCICNTVSLMDADVCQYQLLC
jgi:hypothetical protein